MFIIHFHQLCLIYFIGKDEVFHGLLYIIILSNSFHRIFRFRNFRRTQSLRLVRGNYSFKEKTKKTCASEHTWDVINLPDELAVDPLSAGTAPPTLLSFLQGWAHYKRGGEATYSQQYTARQGDMKCKKNLKDSGWCDKNGLNESFKMSPHLICLS